MPLEMIMGCFPVISPIFIFCSLLVLACSQIRTAGQQVLPLVPARVPAAAAASVAAVPVHGRVGGGRCGAD